MVSHSHALAHVPALVTAHGLREAHPWPLVSRGKEPDGTFSCFRVRPAEAWNYPEIQYGHAGSSYAALVLDCDDPGRWRPALAELPPPNWIVRRPANDHAHVVWTLETPLHCHKVARTHPLGYFMHIAEFYAAATGSDPGYTGTMAHNPAANDSSFETEWGREKPYTLDELASVIPFEWKLPEIKRTGIGRNCDLFMSGIKWAGRAANANIDALAMLDGVNKRFEDPLPLSEVRAIARSIDRYRGQWNGRGWHNPKWLAKQAARGRKGGRPRLYERGHEPWRLVGVSRRTWERRRARSRDAKPNAR